jgi:hypothetical protein
MTASEPGRNRTASAIFTLEELWLLQSVIRHEMAGAEQWHHAPVSLELNDQVADALVRCEESELGEAALLLAWDDCLAIDFCVPQAAKSPAGVPIGKHVLMKSFHARRELQEGLAPTAEEPASPTSRDVFERLRRENGG